MGSFGKSLFNIRLRDTRTWYLLRRIKFTMKVLFGRRTNRIYTRFLRFPHQYKALEDKVIPFLLEEQLWSSSQPLEIILFGCCNGAEPYSISSVLLQKCPSLPFRIRAFDVVEELIEKARAAVYPREEVLRNPLALEAFTSVTFDDLGDFYQVKPEVASSVTFAMGSLLDSSFMQTLGTADIVIAQNVLFHLPRSQARVAFGNLAGLLKSRSALFINGMDTDMRIKLTKRYDLLPLEYLIEEIHEDARLDLRNGWAGAYWGREPFSRGSSNWARKFGTIFLRNES